MRITTEILNYGWSLTLGGYKHKKGRQDKLRSQIFSKISREITVAAKLGSKDPQSNPRLRAAIETAKDANMPKDNINRAISKLKMDKNKITKI